LPGWLGAATPEDFIESTLSDEMMPCHPTVDYENPDWQEEMLSPDSNVQHCAGARIMYRNQCKRSKNVDFMRAEIAGAVAEVHPSAAVFRTKQEFLDHHTRKPTPKKKSK